MMKIHIIIFLKKITKSLIIVPIIQKMVHPLLFRGIKINNHLIIKINNNNIIKNSKSIDNIQLNNLNKIIIKNNFML